MSKIRSMRQHTVPGGVADRGLAEPPERDPHLRHGVKRRVAVYRDAVRLGHRPAADDQEAGRLQSETALFLLGQAARALDTAHHRGLVHGT